MDGPGYRPGVWLCVAVVAVCACGSQSREAAGLASDGGTARDAGRDREVTAPAPPAQPAPAADSGVVRDAGAACEPASCASLGVRCGEAQDGCGHALQCGACPTEADAAAMAVPPPEVITSSLCAAAASCNVCGPCERAAGGCTPRTCSDPGVGCGAVDDGCGGALDCSCQLPSVCDRRNHACCRPLDCTEVCAQGAYAGSDGCGGTLRCSACPPNATAE